MSYSGLDGDPPKKCVPILTPRTCKCDLMWKKRVFTDVIKYLEIRSPRLPGWALISMASVLIRDRMETQGLLGRGGQGHVQTGRDELGNT